MILGFKKQFVEPILNGTKIHTIRKGNRWKPGVKAQMATGVRTKNYHCFKEVEIVSVQDIHFWITGGVKFGNGLAIRSDIINMHCAIDTNKLVTYDLCKELAANDGFHHFDHMIMVDEFLHWFLPNRESIFKGQIIHWTDKTY